MGTENTNDNFSFEEGNDTFFEETAPVVASTQEVLEEVINSDATKPTVEKPAGETAEEEEEEVFFFGENEEEGTETTEDDEEEDETSTTATQKPAQTAKVDNKSTLEFLKAKGIINYELEAGVELTDDLAGEILEDNYEDAVEASVGEKIKGLPDGLKQLIQVATKGGDYTALLKNLTVAAKSGVTADLDLEVEANQELVVRNDLRNQEYDDEYIDTHIQTLKDAGKLKGISEKVKTKQLADLKTKADAEVEKTNKSKETIKERQRQYKSDTTTFVTSANNLKGLVINKKDKEELPSYISDATETMEDGRIVTPLQKKLFEIFGDKENLTILAKLVKSNFDFTPITTKSITDYSNEVKAGVQNEKKKPTVTGSKGSSQNKKSLADYL